MRVGVECSITLVEHTLPSLSVDGLQPTNRGRNKRVTESELLTTPERTNMKVPIDFSWFFKQQGNCTLHLPLRLLLLQESAIASNTPQVMILVALRFEGMGRER